MFVKQGATRLFGCAAALASLFVGSATAQTYPDKPVRMIVTVASGGPIDTIARLTAEQMQSDLGQPIVVENRAGAGGTVGARSVSTADPDGYTLLFSTLQTFAIAPALYQNPGYDPAKFVPVGLVAEFPFVFVIPAQIQAKTPKEFVAFAKSTKDALLRHPGALKRFPAKPGSSVPAQRIGFRHRAAAAIDGTGSA